MVCAAELRGDVVGGRRLLASPGQAAVYTKKNFRVLAPAPAPPSHPSLGLSVFFLSFPASLGCLFSFFLSFFLFSVFSALDRVLPQIRPALTRAKMWGSGDPVGSSHLRSCVGCLFSLLVSYT